MARQCKIGIQIGTGAVQDAQSTWGFYLIESPDILVPPQRDYETEIYPEKDGVQVYAKTTYEQFDYTLKLLCQSSNPNKTITDFYASLFTKVTGSDVRTAKEITIYNYWKDMKIVGIVKEWKGENSYVANNAVMFDLTIQVTSPSKCNFNAAS